MRKWKLNFCPQCLSYDNYACGVIERTKCLCRTPYCIKEAEQFTDELLLINKDGNTVLWQSVSTGIKYRMSLKNAFPLFSKTINGRIHSCWDWRNTGGIVRIFEVKSNKGVFGVRN